MGRSRPKILLKARPTEVQLRDRLAAPVPDGVELYIHELDVAANKWFETLCARFAAIAAPADFTWVVEGPVWGLDGEIFGLCRNAEMDRELVRRLVRLATHLGAAAVNIHCVEGTPDAAVLGEAQRRAALERAFPFLKWFVKTCGEAGVAPLIENVPPICRMRRAAFIYTPIGVEPRDLIACVDAVPGLRLTLDTSHAQLAVNAFSGRHADGGEELAPAAAYYRGVGGPGTLNDYVEPVQPWVMGVHVSNARGILAEGLPYEEGDADLDSAVRLLARSASYFVTEPIDADDDHAVLKRSMQMRLLSVLDVEHSGMYRISAPERAPVAPDGGGR